ncbi:MAG: hypothetical protein K0Q95_2474 [Bacteroidota bacterium]|jgi:hypothetical protein|nr:hypothetical protein [Bacteroidota bacterium]
MLISAVESKITGGPKLLILLITLQHIVEETCRAPRNEL